MKYILYILYIKKVNYFVNWYYICYIVGINEKDKYSWLQYEIAKYILSTPIILIKYNLSKKNQIQINFNQTFIKFNFCNL